MNRLLPLLLLAVSLSAPAAPRALVPGKSEIAFSVKQMGVAVDGHFAKFDAQVDLDPAKLESSSAQVSVDTGSLVTGDAEADETAKDKPWLDAAGFPKATFKSTSIKSLGPDRFEARGTLAIRGKPRELGVTVITQTLADGSTVVSGALPLKRTDFGIGGGEWNESDVVSNEVQVRFKLTLAPAH
jgi:polyisoprenoid-binding protein YceI